MRLIYPATIEKIDNQYWLEFPDLEGCQTWGDSIEEVLTNAEEALEGYALTYMENSIPMNVASELKDIPCTKDKISTYVCCDIEIKSTKPVKKTLTIPEWVNKIGVENNINFSQTLTEAIIQQCQIKNVDRPNV